MYQPGSNGVVDGDRQIDWGRTSEDYLAHRPGPPASFYKLLTQFGIGLPGQRILDLATGTGVLAIEFARQGSRVSAMDIADDQVKCARLAAQEAGVDIAFSTGPAEELPFDPNTFDVITANQCWSYFDLGKVIPQVKRLLGDQGRLLVSSFTYLPRHSEIAAASEAIVAKYNSQWSGIDWDGRIPGAAKWAEGHFVQQGMYFYDEGIKFNAESWRGRMRALRGVGAALSPAEVDAFDAEHKAMLAEKGWDEFLIPHRIALHLLRPA